jgi:UDP-2,3-diacylglucosamine hydrolase
VERVLGVMAGAGVLPARMAREARRQGWRVIAFAFAEAPDLAATADVVVPSRLAELGDVVGLLQRHAVSAVILSGKFWLADVIATDARDEISGTLASRAGALTDANIATAITATLGGLGIALLDQRPFLGDWVAAEGCWSARQPTGDEWADVRRGLAVARLVAEASVGQTVVVRRGAVSAVEAMEGTTETIRRGTRLGGAGAVVVKATAPAHDYRFDTPGIGVETVDVAAAGRAAVIAVEAGRVLVVDRDAVIRRADAAGLALVGVTA